MSTKIKYNNITQHWYCSNVEIGDKYSFKIQPQMKTMDFKNKANLSIRIKCDNCGNDFRDVDWEIQELYDMVIMRYDFIELRFYKVNDNRFENYSPEFETILLKTPTNYDQSKPYKIYYTLRHKNLNFLKQESYKKSEKLLKEEFGADIVVNDLDVKTKDGKIIERRNGEWVLNSYAVYCNQKNNEFGTGKYCHIPRPEMIDSQNNKFWNDIEIDTIRNLFITTVSINLNEANYPLRHISGATVGKTTAGSSSYAFAGATIGHQLGGISGTITSLHVYIPQEVTVTIGLALYSGSSKVNAYVLANNTTTMSYTEAPCWKSVNISYVASGEYFYLMYQNSYGASGSTHSAYDSGGVYVYAYISYSSFPASPDTFSQSGNSRLFSLYFTYGDPSGYASTNLPNIYNTLNNYLKLLLDFSDGGTSSTVTNLGNVAVTTTLSSNSGVNNSDELMWSNGGVGGINFDGSDDYLYLSDISAFTSLTDGSIEFWTQINEGTSDEVLLSFSYSSAEYEYDIRINSNGYPGVYYKKFGSVLLEGYYEYNLRDGKSHHIVYTLSSILGNNLYVDGKSVTMIYSTGSSSTDYFLNHVGQLNTANIGASYYNGTRSNYYNGTMNKLAFYDAVLTAEQIKTIYNYEKKFVPLHKIDTNIIY